MYSSSYYAFGVMPGHRVTFVIFSDVSEAGRTRHVEGLCGWLPKGIHEPGERGSIVCFVHEHGFTLTLEGRAFLPSRW